MGNVFSNLGSAAHAKIVYGNLKLKSQYFLNAAHKQEPICFGYRNSVVDFVGRLDELLHLKEATINAQKKPVIVVVSGLGGIGKTQLVRRFIDENPTFYQNIVWINSNERGSIEAEFKMLAQSSLSITALNVDGSEKNFRCLYEEVFNKLTKLTTLIVFDNVDLSENTIVALQMGTVRVPAHIVITSRIQEWSDSIKTIKLDVLTPDDAMEFVSQQLRVLGQNDSPAEKKELVETLQYFPITLRQATAHINYHRKEDHSYEISNYIKAFNSRREEILSCQYFKNDVLNLYTETTFTTWTVTMNAIEKCGEEGELALRILRIIAYFDADHIPRNIFFYLKHPSSRGTLDHTAVTSAVRLLIQYSMVDGFEGQSVLRIHRLVQQVIRIQLEKENLEKQTIREALLLLTEMLSHQGKHEKFNECLEHGVSAFLSALKFEELVREFSAFPVMIAASLNMSKKYFRAVTFGTDILDSMTSVLGKDHPNTLNVRFYIAFSHSSQSKYCQALEILEDVLEELKIILEKRPDIAESNLKTDSYRKAVKNSEAPQLFDEIVVTLEATLRNDTLSLDSYSNVLRLLEGAVEKLKLILGENHPVTLTAKAQAANCYGKLGKYSVAITMFEEVLDKQAFYFGVDHPRILATKFAMDECIRGSQKLILGKDDMDTIATKKSFCNIL